MEQFIEELFLRTIEDIKNKVESNDSYEVLGISLLLRKLLLDSPSLLNKYNKQHRKKIRFRVCDVSDEVEKFKKDRMFFILDGVDPDSSLVKRSVVELKASDFFKVKICSVDNHVYTIKYLIRFVAHIMGGVHIKEPKDEEKVLMKLGGYLGDSGLSLLLYQLKSIGRVVVKSIG